MGPRFTTLRARRAVGAAAVVVVSAAVGVPAAACPVCDTGTGDAVREGIREDLAVSVAATVLPFALAGGVIMAVHVGLSPARRKGGSDDRHASG